MKHPMSFGAKTAIVELAVSGSTSAFHSLGWQEGQRADICPKATLATQNSGLNLSRLDFSMYTRTSAHGENSGCHERGKAK